MKGKKIQEIKAFILIIIAIFCFISLISYDPSDVSFVTSRVNPHAHNLTGRVGAYFAYFLYISLGYSVYLFPILCLVWAFSEISVILSQKVYFRIIGAIILFISSSSLLSLINIHNPTASIDYGGLAGFLISSLLYRYFALWGSYIILITLFVLSLHLATEFLLWPLVVLGLKKVRLMLQSGVRMLKSKVKTKKERRPSLEINVAKPHILTKSEDKTIHSKPKKEEIKQKPQPEISKKPKERISKEKPLITTAEKVYQLPPLDLLNLPKSVQDQSIKENLQSKASLLEETLTDFGIEAKVTRIDKGPVVTRYELQPAAGVKIQKIVSLSNDIALTLKATSVRVIAPIPGKDRVGIEVPNQKTNIVYLREILDSPRYKQSKSKLTLAIGKDVAGEAIVCDLGAMPHLLIAGTTGSGKTVCVNSIIMSLLFNCSPDEVKFIMVDPKMVELAPFNGIAHLLCPVITDYKKVSAALNWTVSEMEKRYETFANEGVRNIEMYNKRMHDDRKMPYIIVIIDELADLMAVVQNEIENAITRLSQLSRAVGIHMILATQRPSVDVITGVIKANFPTRISFKVSSKVDSRTVLDANGADKLIGSGDMLFLPPGSSKLIRAQGPLVTDEEIERVIDFINKQREPLYNEEILKQQEEATRSSSYRLNKEDKMFKDAVRVILETGHASVSILQRRLGLGYTRAARLIDAMEEQGIVGGYRGSKPREILVDREEYLKKMNEDTTYGT